MSNALSTHEHVHVFFMETKITKPVLLANFKNIK